MLTKYKNLSLYKNLRSERAIPRASQIKVSAILLKSRCLYLSLLKTIPENCLIF